LAAGGLAVAAGVLLGGTLMDMKGGSGRATAEWESNSDNQTRWRQALQAVGEK
jgi:hypothetical protein